MVKGLGWKDKVAAGFTNSDSRSGDKLATLIQPALFAAQHGMHRINLGLPPANHSTKRSDEELLSCSRVAISRRRAGSIMKTEGCAQHWIIISVMFVSWFMVWGGVPLMNAPFTGAV
jgi:hypothetical protein